MYRNFWARVTQLHLAPAAAADAGTQTPEQKAAATAAAEAAKTPEQRAADKKTADDAKAATDAAAAAAETQRKADDTAKAERSKAAEGYVLKLPAGGRVDDTDVATVKAIAKEQGLTLEESQRLLDDHAADVEAASTRFLEQTTADPIYGGAKLAETQRLANVALDKLRPKGTPRGDGFRALLVKSGYQNQLEVVALLADIGKAMAEDGGNAGGLTAGAGKRDPAAVLYGEEK